MIWVRWKGFTFFMQQVLSPHSNVLIFTQKMHKPTERPFVNMIK